MNGKAAPVLASLNMANTLRFYEDKLGFTATYADDPNYGIVKRGDIIIHFWKTTNRIHPENTSFYLYLREGIDELYEEYLASGVIHPNGSISVTPYNMKEFAILDEDGNMIRIGQLLDSETSP